MDKLFFDYNTYFIDEKVNLLKFANEYKVYNESGDQIGAINQKLSLGAKALRLLLNKAMLPFMLEIRNADGQLEATISRGWTFFMSKITIKDANDQVMGTVKQKFKLFKPTFRIFNSTEVQVAEITGDWKAWNFEITDANGISIGTISKKWNGAVKELFTTADKYNVQLNDSAKLSKEAKIAVVASAITVDMVLKEAK